MNSIYELKEQLENLENEKKEILFYLRSLNKTIEQTKDIIYQNCVHIWVIDKYSSNERTEHYCKTCGFYKYD